MKKIRIDQYLVENGYMDSREKAKRSIMAGIVYIENIRVEKASEKVDEEKVRDKIIVKGKECKYVSRAGLKLEKAIKYWNLDFTDKEMLDVGSSTGGFTDCAIQNQVKEVFALDVGTNQLVYKLRVHEQVKVFEKTNFRDLDFDVLGKKFDIITMDVSFISIKLLVSSVKKFLKDDGIFICLIKPQFEVGKDIERNTKGVVIDKTSFIPMIDSIVDKLNEHNLYINDMTISPIKGGKGNVEFLTKITFNKPNIDKEQMYKILSD